MKKTFPLGVIILTFFLLTGCSKGDSGGGSTPAPAPSEANLVIAISPDPGTTIVPVLADSYPFKLLINSAPPDKGVKVDIKATRESDNVVQITQSSQTSSNSVNSIDLQLTGLLPGVVYLVRVDVTSLSTATNVATVNFRVARK